MGLEWPRLPDHLGRPSLTGKNPPKLLISNVSMPGKYRNSCTDVGLFFKV